MLNAAPLLETAIAAAALNAPHVLRSFPRRWRHLTEALCDSSGGQCPDVWHCVPFLMLHTGCTVLALGLLGAAGEASNLPQLNNGVQAAGLSPPCRRASEDTHPLPAGTLVRACCESVLSFPPAQLPGASSQPISVCTQSNASEPPGTERTEEHQTEDTRISAKTHFGSENFSRRLTVPNIKLFFAFAPSLQCKPSKCACAKCKHKPAVAQQTAGPCCCPQPRRNTA